MCSLSTALTTTPALFTESSNWQRCEKDGRSSTGRSGCRSEHPNWRHCTAKQQGTPAHGMSTGERISDHTINIANISASLKTREPCICLSHVCFGLECTAHGSACAWAGWGGGGRDLRGGGRGGGGGGPGDGGSGETKCGPGSYQTLRRTTSCPIQKGPHPNLLWFGLHFACGKGGGGGRSPYPPPPKTLETMKFIQGSALAPVLDHSLASSSPASPRPLTPPFSLRPRSMGCFSAARKHFAPCLQRISKKTVRLL